MAHESVPQPTADEALQRLLDGNARFVSEQTRGPGDASDRRAALAATQHPFAIIFGCADSRVAAEVIFDQGLGDLFVIRLAGPVLNDAVLGSLEYAVEHLHVPLILVLGHERCGAVKATVDVLTQDGEVSGHIIALVDAIAPALRRARERGEADLVEATVRANIELLVERLRESRPILARAVRQQTLRIVGGRYDLNSGTVTMIIS